MWELGRKRTNKELPVEDLEELNQYHEDQKQIRKKKKSQKKEKKRAEEMTLFNFEPQVVTHKCKCGMELGDANYSKVRKMYFCPNCGNEF